MSDAHGLFAERCQTLRTLLGDAPRWPLIPTPLSNDLWTAGVGCSEGPARAYALALRLTTGSAGFVPLTQIIHAEQTRRDLVLFSQGLSPNARMALGLAHRFERCVLVTGSGTLTPDGVMAIKHPPAKEEGLLGRIVGPAVATYIALASCFGTMPVAEATDQVRVPTLDRDAFLGPVAFITCGERMQMAHGLRWKWMEAMGTCDPPIYDVLAFIHGPFQRWFDEPLTLFALRTGEDPPEVWNALQRVVQPKQRLVTLDARLPGLFSFFEHDIAINALLEQALALGLGHSKEWRGFKQDAAIYDLDSIE